MHEADIEFRVNGTSLTRITGPVSWHDQATGTTEAAGVRAKADGSKVQHFTCHADGIGRVLDRRDGRDDWQERSLARGVWLLGDADQYLSF